MIIAKTQADELGVCVERLEAVDRFLVKAAEDQSSPSSAICVARGNTEIFNGAYGWASPYGPPLRLDMITDVQSVTKVITATMVMMLQEDGLLSIGDPLQSFFPEFKGKGKENVCLWHLLAHVSGMSDDGVRLYRNDLLSLFPPMRSLGEGASSEEWEGAVRAVRRLMGHTGEESGTESNDDFFDLLGLSAPLDCEPYTRFDYCSWGYRILAKAAEKVAGETMESFARRRIFIPLGMIDSHFILPEDKWPRVLLREESCRGGEWMNSERNRVTYSGSSGLKTTIPDLLRLGRMFLNEGSLDGARILSPASVRAMTRDYNQTIPPSFYRGIWYGSNWGLGWNIRCGKFDDLGALRSASAYDHAGFGGARLLIDPEYDLVVAFYMVDQLNYGHILHGKLTNMIYAALD